MCDKCKRAPWHISADGLHWCWPCWAKLIDGLRFVKGVCREVGR
jgi:hypothetical protein